MSSGKKPTVLIVDDEQDVREALADVLNAAGYPSKEAEDGLQALEMIQAGFRPCVVLLDLMMPTMSGREFMAHIAGDADPIPIVVITAASQPEREVDQASDLIRKPFYIEKLLTVVRRYCPCDA